MIWNMVDEEISIQCGPWGWGEEFYKEVKGHSKLKRNWQKCLKMWVTKWMQTNPFLPSRIKCYHYFRVAEHQSNTHPFTYPTYITFPFPPSPPQKQKKIKKIFNKYIFTSIAVLTTLINNNIIDIIFPNKEEKMDHVKWKAKNRIKLKAERYIPFNILFLFSAPFRLCIPLFFVSLSKNHIGLAEWGTSPCIHSGKNKRGWNFWPLALIIHGRFLELLTQFPGIIFLLEWR